MLLGTLRAQISALYGQSKKRVLWAMGLSRLRTCALLGKKETALLLLVLTPSFFLEIYGEQLFMAAAATSALVLWCPARLSLRALLLWHGGLNFYLLAFENVYMPKVALALDIVRLKVLFFEALLVPIGLALSGVQPVAFGVIASIAAACGILGDGLTFVSTLNAAFVAIFLPYVPLVFVPICVACILLKKGALAYGLVGLHLLVYGIHKRSIWVLGLFLGVVVFGAYYLRGTISDGARWQFYRWVVESWARDNWLIGNGLGAFQVLGPLIQRTNHFQPGTYWASLHSDWLQALFETGAIGVALLLWVFFDFLARAKDWRQFSSMLAIGGAAAFYYPFQVPIFAIALSVFIAKGMVNEPNQDEV